MTRNRQLTAILVVFLVLLVMRLLSAALVPIVQDEAYYLEWSKSLDWGYFDHPPGVAFVGATTLLSPGSVFMGRLGSVIVAMVSLPFIVGLLRRSGMTDDKAFIAGLLISSFNMLAIFFGVLTTPDAAFVTAWAVALHESAAALDGNRKRWITAGIATGLGLLTKYIMVLIGPVFLWALIRGDARALRSPWPYAGGLVALLVFSPHIAWNASNEWVTMRMQLQHGFQGGHDPGFASVTDLPVPGARDPDGPEIRMARYWGYVPPTGDAPPPEGKSEVLRFFQRIGEYLGALLIVWGAFMAPLIHRFIAALRGRVPPEPPLVPAIKPLLWASTVVPIAFFGFAALFERVEANWPAVYVVGASVLLAGFGASRVIPMIICSAINSVIFMSLVLYAHNPIFAQGRDRVLKETFGYPELADYVAELEGPLFVGREQPTSMIRFYHPELTVVQWPGITQPSEFVRRSEFNPYTLEMVREAGGFWIVLEGPLPPQIPGFEPVEMSVIFDCVDAGFSVVPMRDDKPFSHPCPKGHVHTWFVTRYQVKTGG